MFCFPKGRAQDSSFESSSHVDTRCLLSVHRVTMEPRILIAALWQLYGSSVAGPRSRKPDVVRLSGAPRIHVPLQVSLKAAVLPSSVIGGVEEVSHGAIFNGGLNHPGYGGHVVAVELLITLCLVGGRLGAPVGRRLDVSGLNTATNTL